MYIIVGLLLNIGASIMLGQFMEFNLLVLVPMLMFNIAGICIVKHKEDKY